MCAVANLIRSLPCYDLSGAVLWHCRDFSGGDFLFLDEDELPEETVEPQKGRCVYFNSGAENTHCITPVTAGRRHTLTLWFSRDASADEGVLLASSLLSDSGVSVPRPPRLDASSVALVQETLAYLAPQFGGVLLQIVPSLLTRFGTEKGGGALRHATA
eukprot:SAG11_NODE_8335_length_1027_cov_1.051724_2_plen_159_part_00